MKTEALEKAKCQGLYVVFYMDGRALGIGMTVTSNQDSYLLSVVGGVFVSNGLVRNGHGVQSLWWEGMSKPKMRL